MSIERATFIIGSKLGNHDIPENLDTPDKILERIVGVIPLPYNEADDETVWIVEVGYEVAEILGEDFNQYLHQGGVFIND